MGIIDKLTALLMVAAPIIAQTITTAPMATKVRLEHPESRPDRLLFHAETKHS